MVMKPTENIWVRKVIDIFNKYYDRKQNQQISLLNIEVSIIYGGNANKTSSISIFCFQDQMDRL